VYKRQPLDTPGLRMVTPRNGERNGAWRIHHVESAPRQRGLIRWIKSTPRTIIRQMAAMTMAVSMTLTLLRERGRRTAVPRAEPR
ncbi:hypothetical protein, partial [Streptomyces sp. MZ04]|uniref:hypothetical protein n=1 Tax=Streptomyces sp. MZ04 TaxID=2559236 RepID=UPI001ADEE487